MNLLLDLPRPSRRVVAVVVVAVAAILVAIAATLEPASRSTETDVGTVVSDGGTDFIGAPVDDGIAPKATGDAAGAIADPALVDPSANEIAERDLAATETVDGSSGLDLPTLDARIVRTAAIELDVKRGGFEDAWGEAQAIATATGGYVLSASRSGAGDSRRVGTITMRVPTGKFETALERLRKTDGAKVGRLDVNSQDVTQEYVDTSSRLRHDRAVERRLVALLAEAEGVSEVLAVQNRLDAVQEQIEVARGRLNYLDKLTAMSTIQVTIAAPAKGSTSTKEREQGTLAEAFEDARERFVENVAGAVVWFGGALPALLALGVFALVARLAWGHVFQRDAGVSEEAS